jgi:hypothetical protein
VAGNPGEFGKQLQSLFSFGQPESAKPSSFCSDAISMGDLADTDRFDGTLSLEGARSQPDYWPAWIFGVINPM